MQGYRLCCDFTDVGLVNLVADLLSEDTAATHNRSLCGLVYVGCGSGIEHASSQAHAFFKVLCAAMARVMCLNKDRSDAEKISGDLTRRLRCFIGIVSLRDVVQIGARGEFLQHETHCFGARFQDSNIPDEVFDMVCETIKRRLSGMRKK